MAADCPKPIYGCALDFLLLHCGKPVAGGDTHLEIGSFVRVRLTPVYKEGTPVELTDAKGRPCVDEPACKYLTHYDIEIELCGLAAAHVAWLPNGRLTSNGGASFGTRTDCGQVFAMRIWQELAGSSRKVCDDGEEEWMVHWLPCTTNWCLSSDFEIADGVVTSGTLTGTALPNGGAFGADGLGFWGEYPKSDDGGLPASEIHAYECVNVPPPEPENCQLKGYFVKKETAEDKATKAGKAGKTAEKELVSV